MKANAPEKIYLTKNLLGELRDGWDAQPFEEFTNIEYTRTDAFIEKASEWLCYNYDKYIRVVGSSIYPAYAELCKDFQKAMEE